MQQEKITAKTSDKVIALTFDDGPNRAITPPILDIAEKYGVRFTFFVVGRNIDEVGGSIMKRAHELGCEIANHSKTHSVMSQMEPADIRAEISETNELVYKYVGEYPRYFRPPYISYNHTLFENVDMPFICGCGCDDWDNSVSVERRRQFVSEECGDGCIVLLHDKDDNEKTVKALEDIVPSLIGQGYRLVTLSELFAAKGVTPRSDIEKIYSYAAE